MADINLAQTLLTETDVSRQLRVSLAALRKWRVMSRGPQFVKIGPLVRYRQTDSMLGLHRFPWAAADVLRTLCHAALRRGPASDGRRRTDAATHGFWTPRPREIPPSSGILINTVF